MRSVAAHRRTTVRSCHNSGKSWLSGCLTHWWLRCYQPSLVITTAPTERQVKDVLWKEIRQRHLTAQLPGSLGAMALSLSNSQRAIGLSTNDPVRFQGWHEENILVIVDEASGVAEEIYQAVEGILTGPNARLLLLGNPNYPSGTFFDSFRSPLYQRFHIQAGDVPAHLLPPTWAEERRRVWGESSVMYRVRVLGQFPPQGDNALFSLDWIEAAQQRELAAGEPCEMGVDVAGYGADESVLFVRQGNKIVDAVYLRQLEPMALVGRISAVARRWQPTAIKVDEIGMGWGIVGALEAEGWPVIGVNVGEKAVIKPEEYDNLRTELFIDLAERFRDGEIDIPPDDQLLVDQLTSLTYSYTPKGKRKLVSKEELRKQRGSGLSWASPDRADALALCFAANLGGWTPVVFSGPAREVNRWSPNTSPHGTQLPW
jgi:phage terminase large subunit